MKVLKFIVQLVIFLTLPCLIFTVIVSKNPFIGGIQSFVVLSGSMQPTLPVGSLIYIRPLKAYRVGDVISFKISDENVVTHRIVDKITRNGEIVYMTKGDANNRNDENPILPSHILGATFLMLPFIGYFINFLKTPLGFSSFVIFPTTVFIVFEIWNFKKEFEKHMEQKIIEKIKKAQMSSELQKI